MGVIVREFAPADRAAAAEALEASGAFREEEIRVALGVLDEALAGGTDGGYALLAVENGGQFRGYVCAGSTPRASHACSTSTRIRSSLRKSASTGP